MRDFNHTVNVLVQAYFNETLRHCDCSACAVGNIIVANGHALPYNTITATQWLKYILSNVRGIRDTPDDETEAIAQISVTGYSPSELSRIEAAFENCPVAITADQHMFNGLMAVVDVLADIHGINLEAKEEAKKLFVKV
jgi:hypothetical protein